MNFQFEGNVMRILCTPAILFLFLILGSFTPFAPFASGLETMLVGDASPPLTSVDWVAGDPIAEWKPGQIYLLDFWAPWCPPCIEGFAHMQAIQNQYAEHGVNVVGIAVWYSSSSRHPEAVLEKFPDLTYSLAIDRNNVTGDEFMKTTRSSGLPTAMIIDRLGRLAWVGSPGNGLEQALDSVITGNMDLEQARNLDQIRHEAEVLIEQASVAEKNGEFRAALSAIDQAIVVDPDRFTTYRGWQYEIALLRLKDPKEARAVASKLLQSPQGKDPLNLFVLATRIAHNIDQTPLELRDLDLALFCAQGAVDGGPQPPPRYWSLLARVHALRDEFEAAVAAQQAAVLLAPEAEKPGLIEKLQEYEALAGSG